MVSIRFSGMYTNINKNVLPDVLLHPDFNVRWPIETDNLHPKYGIPYKPI